MADTIASLDRTITIHTDGLTVGLRWWKRIGLAWRNARRARKMPARPPIPARVRIPAKAVTAVEFRPAEWWRRGRVTITAPGYGDPWRIASVFRTSCPHRIKFRRHREYHLLNLARFIASTL